MGPRLPIALAIVVAAGFRPLVAHAQEAPVYLPADHWAVAAAAHLQPIALPEEPLPWGFGPVARRDLLDQLERWASAGPEDVPERVRSLAAVYRDRLLEEMRGLRPEDSVLPLGIRADGHLTLGVAVNRGRLRTGTGFRNVVPPQPRDNEYEIRGMAGVAAEFRRVALSTRIEGSGDGARIDELYASGRVGGVDLWAGRRTPALGGGFAGTVILAGAVPLDGGGLHLSRVEPLPWLLEHLGPVRFETHLARFERNGEVERPWFWTMRAVATPLPLVDVGIVRGVIFGGDGAPPITLRNVLHTLVGSRPDMDDRPEFTKSDFASQLASVELRVRFPSERLPGAFYIEWGMADSAGAWLWVPGIVAGVHLASLPGASGVSLGVERTHFASSCCGNPPWYRHVHFQDGWAEGGWSLGHPLGGDGDEWRIHGRADRREAHLRSAWAVFHRERDAENLFAPNRRGSSLGGSIELLRRVDPGADAFLSARYERAVSGPDWSELELSVGVRAFF